MKFSHNSITRFIKTGILFLLFTGAAYADTTFTGFAGIKGDFKSNPKKENFDPQLTLETYFSGQLAFSDNIFIRGEFSMQTADIMDTGLFEKTDAKFCIDELSATYVKPFLGNTQYISAFLGTYEPIGSDVFLQRQFGIKPISSLITENWLGLKGSSVYPFYGFGASYILHFDEYPIASGFYLFKNQENDDKENQLNLDWRIGSVTKYATVDFSIGVGAPLTTKNGTEDVILLVDTLYLHTGLNALLGNRYSWSIYTQMGFKNLPIKARNQKKQVDSNDIYLIVEPRVTTKRFQANLALFSLPKESVESMLFINDTDKSVNRNTVHTFGFNLSILTETLYIKNKNYTFGFHTTLSFPQKDFMDIKEPLDLFMDSDMNIRVSPFVAMPVMTGNLKFMLQTNITAFKDDGWKHALKLNVGYKSLL